MKYFIAFLVGCGIQTTVRAESVSMIFWYNIPHFIGDGEMVQQVGELSAQHINSKLVKFSADFSTKSQEFSELGGWMANIKRVEGEFTFNDHSAGEPESNFGKSREIVDLIYSNGQSEKKIVDCRQSRFGSERTFKCYFEDQTNSFVLILDDEFLANHPI